MARTVIDVTRELCLGLPGTDEKLSHGKPDFRVRGKVFASFVANHHGDGRIGFWLAAPPGSQELHTENAPQHYFVPPYVGPRGWLGVTLDTGLDWREVGVRVHEAWLHVAPAALRRDPPPVPDVLPPDVPIDIADFDPLYRPEAQSFVAELASLALALPEVVQDASFGSPVFRAGKKTFCGVESREGRVQLSVWVGRDAQPSLINDPRFVIPRYTGHNGWILLDVEERRDWEEIERLVLASYRHFALKRMLKALGDL